MNTLTKSTREFVPYSDIRGVHLVPVVLTKQQIADIYKVAEIKAHHGDGGHGSSGDEDRTPTTFKAEKPYSFPWLADLIFQNIPQIRLENGLTSVAVDSNVQIYTLPEGGGIVPVHVDKDFEVGNKIALYSILIYLNNAYTGGETVFNRNMYAPEVSVGAGVMFRHNIIHEGLEVVSGEKHVLKTDLLFA